jgi:glyoxylase-like metal-dependent hydrolase (beta-lactamase superfamily II)
MIRVEQFVLQVNYVNAYLCYDTETREAFLVDCGEVPAALADFLQENQLELKFVLLTHTHYDHVDGLEKLRKRYPASVYANAEGYDRRVGEGDVIRFGDRVIRVFETPGHTSDGVCYSIADVVFVGDALFAGAVGGTSARPNHEQQLQAVAASLFSLPDDTIVYPGHGAPTTIGVERVYNPFFV